MRSDDDGFTLVELLVAMTLSLIIVFAVLASMDTFTRHTAHQTVVLDGNDQVRTLMDQTVRDLQAASAIVTAQPQDLIYTVPLSTGTQTKRLCVSGNRLYGFSTTGTLTSATPCASGGAYATLGAAAGTGFTYDGATSSATPEKVVNVGLTFALNTSSHQSASNTTLQASASRRIGPLGLDPSDLTTQCIPSGARISVTPPGYAGPVTISYTDGAGNPLGTSTGAAVQIGPGITTVIAQVTNAAGLTGTITQAVDCG